jgi:hypothetical protein
MPTHAALREEERTVDTGEPMKAAAEAMVRSNARTLMAAGGGPTACSLKGERRD